MLSNAYLLAKFRFDTAENERHFAEILPKNSAVQSRARLDRRPSPVAGRAGVVPVAAFDRAAREAGLAECPADRGGQGTY